ncbi:hypothetical protein, partial [Chryseobacterium sp. SIMBA_038]|uniref:hypothetical protein n=1 Tax=Chryseobacterium sp. SIMBA_038 TaxID=3085780 RepID=UPI00397A12C9
GGVARAIGGLAGWRADGRGARLAIQLISKTMGHSMVTTHETIESLTQVEDLLETGDLLGAQRALNHYRPRNDDAQAYTLMSQLL